MVRGRRFPGMRTRNSSYITFYLLLSMMVCVASLRTTARAQNQAAPKTPTTFDGTIAESPDSSTASAPSNSPERADIELLKAQLAQQQKRIEQLERMLDEQ